MQEEKKVWETPRLEELDVEETLSGGVAASTETTVSSNS